jgi:hypothetical protein
MIVTSDHNFMSLFLLSITSDFMVCTVIPCVQLFPSTEVTPLMMTGITFIDTFIDGH